MTPAMKLKQACEELEHKGKQSAYRRALWEVLEDIDELAGEDCCDGNTHCCDVATLKAKVRARFDEA